MLVEENRTSDVEGHAHMCLSHGHKGDPGVFAGESGPGHWALRRRPEKKPVLTPCWNCFFDSLFVAFVITIIIQNGIMPLCLTVKLSAFVQNPVHL